MLRDRGSALVVAVVGVAIFSLVALEILDTSRSTVRLLRAEGDRAKLAAAVDAGLALVIYQLGLKDPLARQPVDGRPRRTVFDGVNLMITVEDARGRIPINKVGPGVERQLFQAAGVQEPQLSVLVDSLEDWKDADDDPRPNGAEAPYYKAFGIRPRNGPLRTVDELGEIKGMDPKIFARIAPAVTTFPGNFGSFDISLAGPMARAAMQGAGLSLEVQKPLDTFSSDRPVLEITDQVPVTGRSLSIRIEAGMTDAQACREIVLEFTGNTLRPYWIKYAR